MNELQFKYGFGGIEDVLNGNVAKVDSQEELKIGRSGVIMLPKLIGVYQSGGYAPPEELKGITEIAEQIGTFGRKGRLDCVHANLICVAYDPTITPRDILRKSLESDTLERLKVIEHYNLPQFSEKRLPEKIYDSLQNTIENPSSQNISVVERNRDVLRMLRSDYGLARCEATDLLVLEIVVAELTEAPEIEVPRKMLGLAERIIEITRDLDFED